MGEALRSSGKIVVSINHKQVTHGLESPLKAGVEVDVISLVVVLQKGSQEYTLRKGDFGPRANEPKRCAVVAGGELDLIVVDIQRKQRIRHNSVVASHGEGINLAVEIFPKSPLQCPIERFVVVGLV